MAYEITLHLKITPFKIQVLYQPLQLSSMSWHVLSQLFCNHLKSVFRCMVILTALVFLLIWRMWLMGSGPPKFQPSDNPASFSDSLLTKVSIFSYMKQINTIILPPPKKQVLTYNYLYSLNAWLLLNPLWLCFDWSMGCVSLVESLTDPRVLAPLVFWMYLGSLCVRAISKPSNHFKR